MPTLIILLPPRPRGASPDAVGSADAGSRAASDYAFVLSDDGLHVRTEGRAPANRLPRADTVIAVIDDADVSWHRIKVPRVSGGRLRAALGGVLEEHLLEDDATVHLALAPQLAAGQTGWVAAVDKAWLAAELATIEKARVFVDRVVPSSWPDERPSGHVCERLVDAPQGDMMFTWADAEGVVTLPTKGTLARAVLPDAARVAGRWSATPAVAAPAEHWLGAPVVAMRPTERALVAARSLWNLRQFDLAPRHKGWRWLADAWRRLRSPAWKPVRWGLGALALAHLLGLNLWAWHESRAIETKRAAMTTLLRSSFPQVRAVLDAPLQMQRETDALRAVAGRAGDADFEPLLEAAAVAWPPERGAVDTLRFEPGRLTLATSGWTPDETQQFTQRLRSEGWRVDAASGSITLSRAGTVDGS
jgi:general secretion pathway protein L